MLQTKKYYLLPRFNCEVSARDLIAVELKATSLRNARKEAKDLPGGILGEICKQMSKQ